MPQPGNALALHHDNDDGVMPLRVGLRVGQMVAPHDIEAAQGAVRTATPPVAGALHVTHSGTGTGPRRACAGMMRHHMAAEGLHPVAPTWQISLNGPNDVDEEQLLTECCQARAG